MTIVNKRLDVIERKGKRDYRMFDSDYLYNTVLECKINTIPQTLILVTQSIQSMAIQTVKNKLCHFS